MARPSHGRRALALGAAVGAGFTPGLSGTSFGVDVNPVADALRFTSDAEQNHRIAFATGNQGAMSPDAALNPGNPSVVASAYTTSALSSVRPTVTTLYDIDAASDQLLVQNPPNAGVLTGGKALGVNVGGRTSFDIAGVLNRGFMATTAVGGSGARLYCVDLATGRASELGPIGTGRLVPTGTPTMTITGIAARQEVVAPRSNIAPAVTIVPPRCGRRRASGRPTSPRPPMPTAGTTTPWGSPSAWASRPARDGSRFA